MKTSDDQSCLILNFGYKKSFSSPEIKLSLNSDSKNILGSPNKCSVVVIGGKYLDRVDEVMRMVDKSTKDIAWQNPLYVSWTL